MKKIILFATLVLAGFAMNAQTEQDPNKKKENNKAPNTTQQRSINEKGVSVKTRGLSKKTTKNSAAIDSKKKEEVKKTETESKPQ